MPDWSKNLWKSWLKTEHNIFNDRKIDASLYLVLYIIVPVIVTYVSLQTLSGAENSAAMYCYLTILISAAGCLYDIINRWESVKSLKNTKLFLMLIPVGVVGSYCLYRMICIGVLSGAASSSRTDHILYCYLITVVIASVDSFICFARNMALMSCAGTVDGPKH